jgi:hypothetical protein
MKLSALMQEEVLRNHVQLENAIETFNNMILYASRGINRVVLQHNTRLISMAYGDGMMDDESFGDECSVLEERIDEIVYYELESAHARQAENSTPNAPDEPSGALDPLDESAAVPAPGPVFSSGRRKLRKFHFLTSPDVFR